MFLGAGFEIAYLSALSLGSFLSWNCPLAKLHCIYGDKIVR